MKVLNFDFSIDWPLASRFWWFKPEKFSPDVCPGWWHLHSSTSREETRWVHHKTARWRDGWGVNRMETILSALLSPSWWVYSVWHCHCPFEIFIFLWLCDFYHPTYHEVNSVGNVLPVTRWLILSSAYKSWQSMMVPNRAVDQLLYGIPWWTVRFDMHSSQSST